jgi:hypothetical protein
MSFDLHSLIYTDVCPPSRFRASQGEASPPEGLELQDNFYGLGTCPEHKIIGSLAGLSVEGDAEDHLQMLANCNRENALSIQLF